MISGTLIHFDIGTLAFRKKMKYKRKLRSFDLFSKYETKSMGRQTFGIKM